MRSASRLIARDSLKDRTMEIPTAESFTQYYGRLRERTLRVVSCIPADKIEWTYARGKFTFGEVLRHVAAIERYMYAENVQLKPSCYQGHGKELGAGYEGVLYFFNQAHKESMEIFRGLSDEVSDVNASLLLRRESQCGNGCGHWRNTRFIIVANYTFTWGCSEFPLQPCTVSPRRK
jgi:uncharacterized damage-inducible protein DinB